MAGGVRLLQTGWSGFLRLVAPDRTDGFFLCGLRCEMLQTLGIAEHQPVGGLAVGVCIGVDELGQRTDDERHRSAYLVGDEGEGFDLLATLDPEEYKGEDEEEEGGQQETRQPTVPPRTTDVYLYLFHFRPLTVVLHGIAEDVAACIEIAEGDQVAAFGDGGPWLVV